MRFAHRNKNRKYPVISFKKVSKYLQVHSNWILLTCMLPMYNDNTGDCILSVKQNVHTQTSCSEKWLAPWATAAVGPRLPSQRCLILMQVNPTLTSSSPHWPIISPSLPLSLSPPIHSAHTVIFSPPCLPSLAISFSPSSLHPLYSPYLSRSLSLFYVWPHLAVSLPLPTSELP